VRWGLLCLLLWGCVCFDWEMGIAYDFMNECMELGSKGRKELGLELECI
jgi:hypothetical protein